MNYIYNPNGLSWNIYENNIVIDGKEFEIQVNDFLSGKQLTSRDNVENVTGHPIKDIETGEVYSGIKLPDGEKIVCLHDVQGIHFEISHPSSELYYKKELPMYEATQSDYSFTVPTSIQIDDDFVIYPKHFKENELDKNLEFMSILNSKDYKNIYYGCDTDYKSDFIAIEDYAGRYHTMDINTFISGYLNVPENNISNEDYIKIYNTFEDCQIHASDLSKMVENSIEQEKMQVFLTEQRLMHELISTGRSEEIAINISTIPEVYEKLHSYPDYVSFENNTFCLEADFPRQMAEITVDELKSYVHEAAVNNVKEINQEKIQEEILRIKKESVEIDEKESIEVEKHKSTKGIEPDDIQIEM